MGAIRLVSAIPGPASVALTKRRAEAVPQGVATAAAIAVVKAENALLTDADGNQLIDFAGGIGVLNAGHRNPAVVAAIRAQLDRYTHTCFAVASYEPYVALAERLNALTPGDHPKRTLLVNTGAEAVENAVKIARYATGRPAIVAFEHAFHGRTNLTMALTAKVMPYKKGFGPFAPEIYRVPYPYCYRCERREAEPARTNCCQSEPGYFDQALSSQVHPSQVAAIILELEAGEGGFIPAPVETVRAVAAFAKANGILLVVDEIQTGFGRTGAMFACDHYGVVPDLMITAKSLAGGLPLAAVTGRAELMDAIHPGGLGGTYGGNPLACSAALAILDVMATDRVVERGVVVGQTIRARFDDWARRFGCIGDVRGLGAMAALELVTDRRTKAPAADLTKRVQAAALKRGLVVLTAGTYGNVLRVLVPLTVEAAVLEEGLTVLGEALADAAGD